MVANTVLDRRQVRRSVDVRTWMSPPSTPPLGSPVENRYQVWPWRIMLGSWINTYEGTGLVGTAPETPAAPSVESRATKPASTPVRNLSGTSPPPTLPYRFRPGLRKGFPLPL